VSRADGGGAARGCVDRRAELDGAGPWTERAPVRARGRWLASIARTCHRMAARASPRHVAEAFATLLAVLAPGCGEGALTALGPALSGPATVELGAVPLGLTHRVTVELRVGDRPLLPGARLELGAEAAASARSGSTPPSALPPGAVRLDPIPARLDPGTVWGSA
jgi:hypothetical protein